MCSTLCAMVRITFQTEHRAYTPDADDILLPLRPLFQFTLGEIWRWSDPEATGEKVEKLINGHERLERHQEVLVERRVYTRHQAMS